MIVTDAIDENKSETYFPKLMNKEIIRYLKKEQKTGLKCILPLSCAFYYRKCENYAKCFQQKIYNILLLKTPSQNIDTRVTFKVFAHKDLSDRILGKTKEKIEEVYKIRNYDGKRFCSEGKYKFEGDLSAEKERNAADAFALSSLLK